MIHSGTSDKTLVILVTLFLVLGAVSACSSAAGTATPSASSSQSSTPDLQGKSNSADWQRQWAEVKSNAEREGRLVVGASAGPAVRDPITKLFADQYKVNIEWITMRSGEILQKILTEQRAGLYYADAYMSGPIITSTLKAQNALEPIDSYLFLPEVLDKQAWWGGNLLYLDKERSWVAFLAFPQPYIYINTDMVKPGEAKGWKDLLDPRWKGKIVLYNPKEGAGIDWATSVAEMVMSPDYLRQFAKQEPVILGDSRQQTEWVARGKYPVAVAARTENMNEFVQLGAPVKIIAPEEGIHLTPSAGGLTLFRNPPHPQAARLFVNWAMTREGGTLLSKLIGGQSARVDVAADFLDPSMVRQPGGKYFDGSLKEDYYVEKMPRYQKIVDEVFGPLMK